MDITATQQYSRTYSRNRNNHRILLLVMIFPILLSISSAQTVPRCCEVCICRSNQVWCEQKGLNTVPRDIPTNTKRLYLFNNNISIIPNGAFAELTKLEILDLRANHLGNTAIKPGVFDGLGNLQALMLSENKLTALTSNTFSGASGLLRLYLKDNLIENIDDDALANLTKLVELKLGNNRLISVPKFINCRGLRRLYLNNNRITRLRPQLFSSISDLEDLTIAHNQLQEIPSSVFGKTSSLRIFDISENKLRSLPKIIRNMTSLHTLNMSRNPISSLPQDFLQKLLKIKVLDLHRLRLTGLPQGIIPRRVYLNMFDVTDNPWDCNCDIQWMIEYMKEFQDVFTSINNVICKNPQRLENRRLALLDDTNGYCKSTAARPRTKPTSPSPPRKPSIDLCEVHQCANGGTCYISASNHHMPACRCLPGWKGVLCEESSESPKVSSTTPITTTTTPSETKSRPKLMIRLSTLTQHSVDIFFPVIRKRMTITTTMATSQDEPGRRTSSRTILPTQHSYRVEGLEAGRTYNICICATDQIYTESRRKAVEDKLCNVVTTLPEKLEAADKGDSSKATSEIESEDQKKSASDDTTPVIHLLDQENLNSEAAEANMLPIYIAIGIGAALVLLLLLLVIFYKRRMTSKHTNNNHATEVPLRPNRPNFSDAQLTTMTQQGIQMQAVLPLLHQNGDCFDGGGTYSGTSCSATTQRIATPTQTESLDRSSNSDGSALSKRDVCYSQGSVGRYSIENARHVTLHPNYRPSLNSRECGSIHRSQGSSSSPDTFPESSFHEGSGQIGVVPVLSTATSASHHYHGAMTTTGCLYQMPSTSNSARINGCRPDVARTRQVPAHHTPTKQLRYSDTADLQYGDSLYAANHLLQNQVNRPFAKTLAV